MKIETQYAQAVQALRDKINEMTALIDAAPAPHDATWADIGSVNYATTQVDNAVAHIPG